MRGVLEASSAGDPDAQLARKMVVERIRKYVGAYIVKLGGNVDALIFTGGIGENDHALREAVCEGLSSMGIELDSFLNSTCTSDVVAKLHQPFSKTKVLVVPADEELSIATQSTEAAKLFQNCPRWRNIA